MQCWQFHCWSFKTEAATAITTSPMTSAGLFVIWAIFHIYQLWWFNVLTNWQSLVPYGLSTNGSLSCWLSAALASVATKLCISVIAQTRWVSGMCCGGLARPAKQLIGSSHPQSCQTENNFPQYIFLCDLSSLSRNKVILPCVFDSDYSSCLCRKIIPSPLDHHRHFSKSFL